jgi:hypothetical protein
MTYWLSVNNRNIEMEYDMKTFGKVASAVLIGGAAWYMLPSVHTARVFTDGLLNQAWANGFKANAVDAVFRVTNVEMRRCIEGHEVGDCKFSMSAVAYEKALAWMAAHPAPRCFKEAETGLRTGVQMQLEGAQHDDIDVMLRGATIMKAATMDAEKVSTDCTN